MSDNSSISLQWSKQNQRSSLSCSAMNIRGTEGLYLKNSPHLVFVFGGREMSQMDLKILNHISPPGHRWPSGNELERDTKHAKKTRKNKRANKPNA